MKQFKTAIVIARLQPMHYGHANLIEIAGSQADEVIVIVGSTLQARTIRNPFTFEERREMILGARYSGSFRLYVLGIPDSPYDVSLWQQRLQIAIASVTQSKKSEIAIVGCNKDSSTSYLTTFPQWTYVDPSLHSGLGPVDLGVNATAIREGIFAAGASWRFFDADAAAHGGGGKFQVPAHVRDFLSKFSGTPEFDRLKKEFDFAAEYKRKMTFVGSPEIRPIYTTVDAVVVQGGHVVLVKRKSFPGKGLGAVPGGHLEQHETLLEGAIRELVEETDIDVPVHILRSSVSGTHTFDDPFRSSRGRTISQGYLFDLDHELENRVNRGKPGLAKIRGRTDAARAKWVPISELDPTKLFEDHAHIIAKMLTFKGAR